MALSKDNEVYTWGKGLLQADCLGHGDGKAKKHPTKIRNKNLFGRKVIEIQCGDGHMVALVE